MEDQSYPQTQEYDSKRSDGLKSAFKLPLNYSKIKKDIAQSSPYSKLVAFLNGKASISSDALEFCRHLLDFEGFASFKTVHLFKHEKGQSFAVKYEVSAEGSNSKEFHVNEFNHLFQAIKKSKNRTFGQESLKGFDFDIIGTFLAREFALANHNIILVVSRNDFLPQSKIEKQAFSQVMKVVAPYLNLILDRALEAQNFWHTKLAFDNIPYVIQFSEDRKSGFQRLPSGRYYKAEITEALDKADIFHQERVALLGELLNTLKHELSNPLFGLQLSAQLLCHEFSCEEHTEFINEINASIKRSQSIISNFTDLYTSSERLCAADLEKMVREIFTLTKSQSRSIFKNYQVAEEAAEDFLLEANSVWLAQILFNLVINSAQALNQAGVSEPRIEVRAYLRKPFEIHVIDNGPGALSQTAENMFKPFYTTKEKGTGLGLAISQSLALKLNGKIEYISQGQGAHFVLKLRS